MPKKCDDDFINELFCKFEQMMLKRALRILDNRHEAEDAVQNAFLRIIDNPKKIISLPIEQQPFYLVSVIKNVCYDMMKEKERHPIADTDEYPEFTSEYSVENQADEKLLLDEVKSTLKLLSEMDYGILYLLYFQQMSPVEIANALDISEKNIYKYIDRAKKRLVKKLNERGIYYDL